MLAPLRVASTEEFAGFLSSTLMVPSTSAIRPLTVVIIRCLAENSTRVCIGSSFHWVLAPITGAVSTVAVIGFFPLDRCRFEPVKCRIWRQPHWTYYEYANIF